MAFTDGAEITARVRVLLKACGGVGGLLVVVAALVSLAYETIRRIRQLNDI